MVRTKRVVYSKDEVFFQAVDLFETESGLRVLGVAHENQVRFFFTGPSNTEGLILQSENDFVFQIENKPRPDYKDIFLTCSFGIISGAPANQLVFACAGEIGYIYLLYLDPTLVNNQVVLKGHFNSVMQLRFLKHHRNRLLSCSQDHSIILWDLLTSQIIHKFIDIDNEMSCVNCLVYS